MKRCIYKSVLAVLMSAFLLHMSKPKLSVSVQMVTADAVPSDVEIQEELKSTTILEQGNSEHVENRLDESEEKNVEKEVKSPVTVTFLINFGGTGSLGFWIFFRRKRILKNINSETEVVEERYIGFYKKKNHSN